MDDNGIDGWCPLVSSTETRVTWKEGLVIEKIPLLG